MGYKNKFRGHSKIFSSGDQNNANVFISDKPGSFKLNLNFLTIILEPDSEEIWIIMGFSEREGHKKPKHNPLESMDASLKNAIWTVIYTQIDNCYISIGCTGYGDTTYRDTKAENLWTDYFEQNISRLPSAEKYLNEIEKLYFKLEWHEVYGLIEHILKQDKHFNPEKFNKVLTKYNAAYRVNNSIVQPISDDNIIKNMEAAKDSSLSQEVREHLYKAQTLLSHKKCPDFNNSCLESIKAVEGTCRIIVGNEKILGDNIKEIKKLNYNQHLVAILEKINAFRNDVSAHATKKHGYLPTREDAILIHNAVGLLIILNPRIKNE